MVGSKPDPCLVRDLLICLIYYLFDLPHLCIKNMKCLGGKTTQDEKDERDERNERVKGMREMGEMRK